MRAKTLAILACLAVAIAAVTALFIRNRSRGGAAPVSSIRLGVQDNAICALPFIAAQRGYFRQKGLDAEVVRYPSGKLALKAMLAGDVDVAAVADMPIMSHSLQRDDFAVFASIAWTEQGAWLLARKDKGISGPTDLAGKRVATQRNSAVHFFLSMFLLKHGIADSDVELVFMKAVELPQALADGRIDAFSMRNPFIRDAKELIADQALEMFDPNVYRQTFNLVTWKERLRTDSATVERLLAALVEAENLLIRDEELARSALVAHLGVAREAEVRADWGKYTFSLTLDQSLFVTLEDQARWALARNPELGDEIPNYLGFVDTRPMAAVKPEAVSVIR
jgi:ABC-type nitrate/sulfonate/bicarbonate transport system substrate-binding protein